MKYEDKDVRILAKIIMQAQKQEAWGHVEGQRRVDAVWPQDEKAWRALEHNPIADIDLAWSAGIAIKSVIDLYKRRREDALQL